MKNLRSILIPSTLLLSVSTATAQPVHAGQRPQGNSANPISPTPSWWTQLGGSATHQGSSTTPRTSGVHLSTPEWTTNGDGEIEITFTAQAGVVADEQQVYGLGLDAQFRHRLSAFDQETGELQWSTEIPFTILDSWSMPAIDANNDTVIAAGSFELVALDRWSGEERWSTPFGVPIVNASPCVTTDLGDSDRVFITDYTFSSGATGSLVCINVDAFNTMTNPYQPGQVVWTASLPGDTSGNTPTYCDGIVYVSTGDNGAGGSGHVLAYDATSTTTPAPIWNTTNTKPLGFFGGVTYADGCIYASSYNFHGGQRSANTIKLDAITGAIRWSVDTVRTDASPVILPNGRVVVSGGLPVSPTSLFTGSLPAIELIGDLGDSAILLWDSFEATHEDLNSSGSWDVGEPYLSIGGWGHHPIYVQTNHAPRLLVATMSPPTSVEPFTHASELHMIDLSKSPSDPGFVLSSRAGTGTTPALVGDRVFSTSDSGLSALTLRRAPQTMPLLERIRSVIDGRMSIRELEPTR